MTRPRTPSSASPSENGAGTALGSVGLAGYYPGWAARQFGLIESLAYHRCGPFTERDEITGARVRMKPAVAAVPGLGDQALLIRILQVNGPLPDGGYYPGQYLLVARVGSYLGDVAAPAFPGRSPARAVRAAAARLVAALTRLAGKKFPPRVDSAAGRSKHQQRAGQQRPGQQRTRGDRQMRFLMTTTAGDPPDEQMMADMGKFVAELSQAGVLLATGGLDQGSRVTAKDGQITVTDGPFAEAKEAIISFALLDVRSKDEAIELSKRFWQITRNGAGYIHQVYGPE